MKKMIMMFFLILTVGFVQAASINWKVDLGNAYKGKTLYAFNGGDYNTIIGYLTTPSENIADQINTFISEAAYTDTLTGRGSKSGAFSDAAKNVFFVVTDETALVSGGQFWYTGSMPTDGFTYEPPQSSPATLTANAPDFKVGVVAGVPEPTTFALLALGMAAFGLRRKIRA